MRGFRRGRSGRLAALAALGLCAVAGARAESSCPPASLYRPDLPLPRLKAALEVAAPVVIVALGSSSTQGWMSSDPAHNFPALLQAGLEQRLPRSEISVLNRGIGGQDATEELARIDADAIAVRPALVIWQVGANGAMRGVDPAVFRERVAAGLAKLREAGADVILMDNQRSPRVMASPHPGEIERVLAELAQAGPSVGLFSRSRLMDAWRDAGHPYADFVAQDGLHHNDLGYACVAASLADAIFRAAAPEPTAHIDAHASRD